MTITQLVTHSGGFHADELLSSVILTRLFPDATVLRSRDMALAYSSSSPTLGPAPPSARLRQRGLPGSMPRLGAAARARE